MKIVVLDGYTTNPGDLSWQGIESLSADCTVYERTEAQQVLARAAGAECLLVNKVVLNQALLQQLPKLKYIGVLATGVNVIDLPAARALGICVTNIPAYGPASVAQMVFSHLLNLVQPVSYYAATVREGRWSASPDFCYYDHSMLELEGMTMGLVGFGAIAQRVAKLAEAFGMRLLVHARRRPETLPANAEYVSCDELFSRSDVVSLHCPLNDENQQMVSAARLDLMKSSAYLINTARGPLVDEVALHKALRDKDIAGAALDVLSQEPPAADNPLLALDNCVITPHIAWATLAARGRLLTIAEHNLRAFINGRVINQVN